MKKVQHKIENFDKYWIVTVVDAVTITSMEISEFVIYRAQHGYGCRQTVLVYCGGVPDGIKLPENVEFCLLDGRIGKIRQVIKALEKEASGNNFSLVYHLHGQKSALPFYGAVVGMGIRKRVLFTVHSTFRDRNFKYKISSALCVLLAQQANCVSYSAFDTYSKFVKKVKGSCFTVISNGADFERIQMNKRQLDDNRIHNKRKCLVCAARLIPLKNHFFLLDLIKQLPGYKLVLIGTGTEEKMLRDFVNANDLNNRVIFTGLISRDAVFQRFFQCGIYVSPSFVEGMPVSVLEAMSAGLVPVLSDIGPHREIKEKCNDVRVLPLDVQKWAAEIDKLGSMSEKEYDVVSEACKNSVKNIYSLEIMHKKYFSLYASIDNFVRK